MRYAFNRVNNRAGEVVRRVRFVLTARAVMGGGIDPGVRVRKGDRVRVREREGGREGGKVHVMKGDGVWARRRGRVREM